MNDGFIFLHRKMKDWEWYQDSNTMRVFIHLLLTANHKEKKWQGVTIRAGQLITGRMALAKEIGITPQTVRTSLTRLKSTSEITIKSTNRFSLITIAKWHEYQRPSTSKITSKLTNNQPATNQQSTTTNNDNNDNNVNKGESTLTVRGFSYKRDIGEEVMREISRKYEVSEEFVQDCWDSAQNWCDAKGKVQKDYRAFLSNWVKKEKANLILKIGKSRGGVFDARTK